MPIIRSARTLILLAIATVAAVVLAPASAPASALTREERASRREERVRAREERVLQREERTQDRSRGSCQLTAQASAARVDAGEGVSLSGKLVCAQAASAGESVVSVYRAVRGAASSLVGTAATQADGTYELQIASLEADATFYVRAPHARGARVAVKVAPHVTLASPAVTPNVRGARTMATFTGTVSPTCAGAHVALQSSFAPTTGQWRTIAYGRVDAQGAFSITRGFRLPGERWIRAVVHPARGTAPAASEPLEYDVSGGQNPALTIASSAPLIAYGQSVTISGSSVLGAGHAVTLLARSAGGALRQLLTGTTGEGGSYSFTAQPTQRTWYEVRVAFTRSRALMQNVGFALTPAVAPTSIQAGRQVTLTGTVAPATPGQRVELQASNASGIGFHTLVGVAVEGSGYALAYTFTRPGSYTLRVTVTGAVSGLQSAASASGLGSSTGGDGLGLEGAAGAPFTLEVTAVGVKASSPPAPPA